MLKKTARFAVSALALILAFHFMPEAAAVDVSARGAALYDAAGGRFLYEKNAEERLPIASTTKAMTALVVLEHAKLTDIVTIKKEYTLVEGSSMYLKEGEKYTVEELLYGLLLLSGNDAALALAGHCGGLDAFVGLMNGEAASLGLTDTHFENPHGLEAAGHYSSAQDMAVLSARCMENPVFRKIVSTKDINIAGRHMVNHNRLLKTLDGAEGIKTGYTRKAGRCLLSSALRDGQRLIAVTLDAPDDWRDHERLYSFGFSEYPKRTLTPQGCAVADVPVISGDIPFVSAAAEEEAALCLNDGELARLERVIELPRFVYAPVLKGGEAGALVYKLDGTELFRAKLVYDADAYRTEPPRKGLLKLFQSFLRRAAGWIGL